MASITFFDATNPRPNANHAGSVAYFTFHYRVTTKTLFYKLFCRFLLSFLFFFAIIKKNQKAGIDMDTVDPITKRQLEIPKGARWVFFTLGTSALPSIIRVVILILTSQGLAVAQMRSELFFLVVVCLVDTVKNCRHHPIWVLSIAFALILCSIIYGMALADYLQLLTVELFAGFDSLMIIMVSVSIVLDGFTTAKYGD